MSATDRLAYRHLKHFFDIVGGCERPKSSEEQARLLEILRAAPAEDLSGDAVPFIDIPWLDKISRMRNSPIENRTIHYAADRLQEGVSALDAFRNTSARRLLASRRDAVLLSSYTLAAQPLPPQKRYRLTIGPWVLYDAPASEQAREGIAREVGELRKVGLSAEQAVYLIDSLEAL